MIVRSGQVCMRVNVVLKGARTEYGVVVLMRIFRENPLPAAKTTQLNSEFMHCTITRRYRGRDRYYI